MVLWKRSAYAAVETIPSAEKAEWDGKVQSINPSTYFDIAQHKSLKLRSGLVLKATNSKATHSAAAAGHKGTAAVENEAARSGTTNRATPQAAERADIEERAIIVAIARQGKFKWRGKSACCIIWDPA